MIPQADPRLQYQRQREAIDAAVAGVLSSGRYIMGPEVEAFEHEFAAFCGTRHAVSVANGTDAIRLALWSLGIASGDEVLVPAHTATATVAGVEAVGATAVLVDIDAKTYTMDPEAAEAAITDRTRAVLPVHLYGQPASMNAIEALATRHGLAIVEDCAQAHGAVWAGRHVGGFGAAGCFSFYPTKNLGALGDGGAVVTNDAALAERVRLLREYGWRERYASEIPGYNSRLDELQAAILRVKLQRLDTDIAERRNLAAALSAGLAPVMHVPREPEGVVHAFHMYVIEVEERSRFRKAVQAGGVGTGVHYPWPIHLQGAYTGRLGRRGDFPVAESVCGRVVSLPLYPGLASAEVARIVDVVRSARTAARP